MSGLPILDEEMLERNYGDLEVEGEPSFLGQLIVRFLSTGPSHLESVIHAVKAKDPNGLRLQAHSFKGRAANLGAKALAEVCGKFELLGENGNLQEAAEHFYELTQEYDKAHAALEKKLKELEKPK